MRHAKDYRGQYAAAHPGDPPGKSHIQFFPHIRSEDDKFCVIFF